MQLQKLCQQNIFITDNNLNKLQKSCVQKSNNKTMVTEESLKTTDWRVEVLGVLNIMCNLFPFSLFNNVFLTAQITYK